MPSQLPADFDAAWYAATYRDVALSGLDPREHYRRFGALLGRPPKGSPAPAPQRADPVPEPVSERPKPSPAPVQPEATRPRPPKPKPAKTSPIIDRPEGFDALTAVPQPAPPKAGRGAGGLFSLDTIATTAPGSEQDIAAVTHALQAYARLLRLPEPSGPAKGGAGVARGASAFQSGATRIENAWFADASRLRLMLAGAAEGATDPGGWAVRAYQAHPATPADLRMAGQGVQLPPVGPVLHDLELLHPLMPLLLELSDVDGTTRAIALLPFPSLLPGGLHGAELKALQTEPNPMDDFWALSDALLQEALGGADWPNRSVANIRLAGEGAAAGQALTPPVQEWLSAVFGLALDGATAPDAQAVQLVLPPDHLPTISALVSRRLHADESASVNGPNLVADVDSCRPRWSIALPAEQDAGSAIPVLRRGEAADGGFSGERAPVPLGIAFRSRTPAPAVGSATDPRSVGTGGLSMLVYAFDAPRSERLIQSIRASVDGEVEWLVSVDHPDADLRAALDRACGDRGWVEVPRGTELRQVARDARHETMLTISDRVELGDGRSLRAVLDLLQRDETSGSASCALLAEKIIKKEIVLQPASGGLFPTGVSFVSGPRLSFGEPDALQALPDLTYPVVANTVLLTAWRRKALRELPPVPGTGTARTEDVRIGLDLMRAGYRNWCTTKVTARLSGPYVPRDQIDPVGAGYLPPERWEDILSRVTIVRELF